VNSTDPAPTNATRNISAVWQTAHKHSSCLREPERQPTAEHVPDTRADQQMRPHANTAAVQICGAAAVTALIPYRNTTPITKINMAAKVSAETPTAQSVGPSSPERGPVRTPRHEPVGRCSWPVSTRKPIRPTR
jgi:hypothetical protein